MTQTNKKSGFQDYVTVAERIERFYAQYPNGRLISHIVEHDQERGFIMMRAEVFRSADDAQPAATGHAYELKTEGYVQRNSYIEVCETSAIGRALAMAGFEVRRGLQEKEPQHEHEQEQKQGEQSNTENGSRKYSMLRNSIKTQLDRMKENPDFIEIDKTQGKWGASAVAYINDFLAAESRNYDIAKISDIRDEDCELVFNYLSSYKERTAKV